MGAVPARELGYLFLPMSFDVHAHRSLDHSSHLSLTSLSEVTPQENSCIELLLPNSCWAASHTPQYILSWRTCCFVDVDQDQQTCSLQDQKVFTSLQTARECLPPQYGGKCQVHWVRYREGPCRGIKSSSATSAISRIS